MKRELASIGDLYAILAAFLWATIGIFGKFAYQYGIDPFLLVALRASVSAAIVGVALLIFGLASPVRSLRIFRIRPADFPLLMLLGFVGVTINYGSYFYALQHLSVAQAVLLLYTYPAITAVLARIFLKESFTIWKMISMLITLSGLFFVVGGVHIQWTQFEISGIVAGLIASLAVACYNLLNKVALRRYAPQTLIFYTFLFGAILLGVLTVFVLPATWGTLPVEPVLWLNVLALALLPTIGGYFIFLLALQRIEAGRASILATMEPVVAALLAYFVLGERMTPLQIGGGILVIIGALLLIGGERAKMGTKGVAV